jgi:protein-tyrosine phosphatase
MSGRQVKILFVCTGNICRSPTAEGVFKHFVAKAGLEAHIASDSAGTHDYHIDEPPDPRSQRAAAKRGYDLASLRGRQVSRRDFDEFDHVLAMDETHLRLLARLCPPSRAHKLRLFMEFAADPALREVPDPYYGGAQGFEHVLDLVEQASQGLLEHLRQQVPGGLK